MKYAYMRVSTTDQNLDRQVEAIRAYAKDSIPQENYFADKASGKDFDRAEYQRLKATIQPGDELIIKELDRLGRNKNAIKDELRWFSDNRIILRILDLPTSLMEIPSGQEWILDMVNNILIEVMSAMAQQERDKIRSRQAEGIAIARAEGKYSGKKHTGRRRKHVDPIIFENCYQENQIGMISQRNAAELLDISQPDVSRRFAERSLVGDKYNPNVAMGVQDVIE